MPPTAWQQTPPQQHPARDVEPSRLVRLRGVGVSVPEFSRACLIRCIDYPELPLRTSIRETVKCSRSSLVVRAEVPLGDRLVSIAYKRFRRRNTWKVVSGVFKPCRAFHGWRTGNLLRDEGIATPRPLFAIAPRSPARRIDSYLATQWITGESLHQALSAISKLPSRDGGAALRAVAERVGTLLGRLHRRGFRHRDLKPGNLMITGDIHSPETLAAILVDLDGVSRKGRVNRRMRIRNLARLWMGFDPRSEFRRVVGDHLLRSYLAACGEPATPLRTFREELFAATERRLSQRQRRAA